MELHGCKGCGSTVVEALLELAGANYARSVFDWDDRAAWDRLRAINPLAQVPTLVLDDGTILTESAGIALWIADRYPEAQLLPEAAGARALAYRWIVSFATNIYGPIIVGDFPERWVDGEAAHEPEGARIATLEGRVVRVRGTHRTVAISAGVKHRRAGRVCRDDLALASRSRVACRALPEGDRGGGGGRTPSRRRVGLGAQLLRRARRIDDPRLACRHERAAISLSGSGGARDRDDATRVRGPRPIAGFPVKTRPQDTRRCCDTRSLPRAALR